MTTKQQQLEALTKLIDSMSSEKDLPRDLALTFEEIKQYIIRNS